MRFFDELKRRNVIRVGFAYVVVGWLTAQVAEFATENFGAPEWVLKMFVVFLILGLPFVLILAWAFEMTPEGIKKEKDVDRSQSITKQTGRKLDYTIIGVLVLVAAYFVWESRFSQKRSEPFSQQTAVQVTEINDEKIISTVVISDNSIAVLPFANRSKLEEDEFFTDGMHDDLLTQLAKIHDLKVISRTSMMKYKDTKLTIPEIARELGVSTILEGGVQRAGKRIRINAQLIDVNSDQHLWAETFDREMTMENIFDIQSEITRQIVTAVRGELSEAEALALNQLPTTSIQAYDAFLRARALVYNANYAKENYISAQPWAKVAVELDPEFAQAWSLLAIIHGQALWIGYDVSPERRQAMKKAVDTAGQLAPDQPWSLLARAEYQYRVERDYSSSLAALQKAHTALPGNVDILVRMSMSQRRLGLWEDSVNSNFQAIALDPGNVTSTSLALETLVMMKKWDQVISLGNEWSDRLNSTDQQATLAMVYAAGYGNLKRARQLINNLKPLASNRYADLKTYLPLLEHDYPAAIAAWDQPELLALTSLGGWLGWRELYRGWAYTKMGESEKARAQFSQAVEFLIDADSDSTGDYSVSLGTLALAYASLGEHAKALAASNKAKALMPESLDALDGTFTSGVHAQILGMAGHRDEALLEIERLLDTPYGLVRWFLYLDPMWDFFRDDERFNELVRPKKLTGADQ